MGNDRQRRSRRRVALLPSEALRPRMAGIGLRYLELARRLPAHELDVVLVQPGEPEDVPVEVRDAVEVRRFERGALARILDDCDVAVSQGQLANDLVLERPELPSVIDLYDPFLVENLHYAPTLGLDPWRNDHATWVLQLARGDFFLCSCDEQRQYYLGFLTALGRVNPRRVEADPDLRDLIEIVPFGVPEEVPPHRAYLSEVLSEVLSETLPETRPQVEPEAGGGGVVRLLFGGLYDWYDPWPVLEALAEHRRRDSGRPWRLLFIRNPNPGTPQELMAEVERWCRERGLWAEGGGEHGTGVDVIDWVPVERRYDLLRDVDLLVATHRPSLETRLSLRTRFLDALAVGCPVIATEGGGMSRLLSEHDAGEVVPVGDAGAVAAAVQRIVGGERHQAGRRELVERFAWDRVMEPLVAFCREPRVDPWKESFAFRPETVAPPDELGFRVRRKLGRTLERVGRRLDRLVGGSS